MGTLARPLSDLASEINAEHEAAERAINDSLQHARRCGELLIEAKSGLTHGAFGGWLSEHFRASHQTATGYMRIARRWAEVQGEIESASSIRGALALLAEPREDPESEDEAPTPVAPPAPAPRPSVTEAQRKAAAQVRESMKRERAKPSAPAGYEAPDDMTAAMFRREDHTAPEPDGSTDETREGVFDESGTDRAAPSSTAGPEAGSEASETEEVALAARGQPETDAGSHDNEGLPHGSPSGTQVAGGPARASLSTEITEVLALIPAYLPQPTNAALDALTDEDEARLVALSRWCQQVVTRRKQRAAA